MIRVAGVAGERQMRHADDLNRCFGKLNGASALHPLLLLRPSLDWVLLSCFILIDSLFGSQINFHTNDKGDKLYANTIV